MNILIVKYESNEHMKISIMYTQYTFEVKKVLVFIVHNVCCLCNSFVYLEAKNYLQT